MPSNGSPESTRVGWLHPQHGLRWMALACAAAALSGVVTYTVKQTQQAKAPVDSESPGVTSLARQLEPPLQMRGTVHNASLPPSTRGHIRIPAIGVDASVIPLGLTPDGALDVPKAWGTAGWFEGGPFPGEPGPAVVVGHVDSTSGPAVFYRLRELSRGDVIVVWRKGGVRSRFRVVSLRWFSKSAFPTELVYRSVDTPALRLITCGGAFDSSTGHYVDNLVVFASPMTNS